MRQSIVVSFLSVEEGRSSNELFLTAKIGYLISSKDYHFTFSRSGLIDHDAYDELEEIKKGIHAEIRNFLIERLQYNFDIDICKAIIDEGLDFDTTF